MTSEPLSPPRTAFPNSSPQPRRSPTPQISSPRPRHASSSCPDSPVFLISSWQPSPPRSSLSSHSSRTTNAASAETLRSSRFGFRADTSSAVRLFLPSFPRSELTPLCTGTVRCLVKMQKRGQDACPNCRSPVVLRANAGSSFGLPVSTETDVGVYSESGRDDGAVPQAVVPQGGAGEGAFEFGRGGEGGVGGDGAR